MYGVCDVNYESLGERHIGAISKGFREISAVNEGQLAKVIRQR